VEQVGSQIAGQAAKGKSDMRDFDLAERDSGRRQWWDSDNLSQAEPQCRPGKQLEDHVGSFQAVQLVSMAGELPSPVVMVTWLKGEQQDWHTGWHEMRQHSGRMDILAQSLLLVFRVWVSLGVVENLVGRV